MRVLFDTNVLFSALVFPSGLCHKALSTAILLGDEIVIPDYVKEELVETIERKFPNKIPDILPFLETISHVSFSSKTVLPKGMPKLRDEKDQPVLAAAIMTGCDFILTGDRDFLESGISRPQPIHPKDYLEILLLRF